MTRMEQTTSSRPQIRQQIKIILIRRLGLPAAEDASSAELRRKRLDMIKMMSSKIETSLYRRSKSMDWYEDVTNLERRVELVIREVNGRRTNDR